MKKFDAKKMFFWQNNSFAKLAIFIAPLWKSGGCTGFTLSFRHSVILWFSHSVTFEMKIFRHTFLRNFEAY